MIGDYLMRLWRSKKKGGDVPVTGPAGPVSGPDTPPATPDPAQPAIGSLKAKMRKTAQARFFASKRLQTRDQKITRLTALSSAYLIGLTALPYFLDIPPVVEDHVNLVTLIVAVIVLVSSLLQYSRLDVVSAEQHHRCGLEINEVLREFGGPGP